MGGRSIARGHGIVHEAAGTFWPVFVVDHLFAQRAADPHGDGAVLLAVTMIGLSRVPQSSATM